jgi:hypothetical protein
MARIGAAELGKRAEEMIVPGLALGGHEAAHGEGVHELVIEVLVLGNVYGANAARLACGLRLGAGLDRLRFGEGFGGRIDAEPVLTADAKESLGIDRAVEVIVKVGALRHTLEEDAQRQRISANGIELLDDAKLAVLRLLLRKRKHRH